MRKPWKKNFLQGKYGFLEFRDFVIVEREEADIVRTLYNSPFADSTPRNSIALWKDNK